MAIVYDAPSNTITVTGYTSGTPCTFLDIWNADQAGGWGVVSKQGNRQFMFDAFLTIGDGSTATWFADIEKQISFPNSLVTATYTTIISITNNANFTIGEVINEANKATRRGCSFIHLGPTYHTTYLINATNDATCYIYSSKFQGHLVYAKLLSGVDRIWNVVMSGCYITTNLATDNFNVLGTYALTFIRRPVGGTWEKIVAYGCSYVLYFYSGYGVTVRNLYGRNNGYIARISAPSVDSYFIDFDIDNWLFYLWTSGTGKVYRQYSFNRKILSSTGSPYTGKVWTLKNKDGSTAASGTTQTDGKLSATDLVINHGYFHYATGNTEQTYGPFKLEVEGNDQNEALKLVEIPIDVKDVVGVETMPAKCPKAGAIFPRRVRTRIKYVKIPPKRIPLLDLYSLFMAFQELMVIDEQIWSVPTVG